MTAKELGLFVPNGHDFTIPVKQFVQNNNTGGEGYRECFDTSVAMVADYLTKGFLTKEAHKRGFREPEDAWYTYRSRYGDTTDSSAQIKALRDIGIEAYFSTTASINDVAKSLYLGIPVVIGTAYKSSGHMVVVNGRDNKGFRILCPYGIRNGSTNQWIEIFYQNAQARPDGFSWTLLKRIFTDLGDEAGWALFFTKVGSINTGVPKNL
jgi:hypothetical protein